MLTVVRHRPEPNEEVEQRVRAELQQIDSLLDIRWVPTAVFNPQHRDFEGRYALICNWPSADKRWEMYRTGEIGEHFDALGWFCTDIHDPESVPVSPDSIGQKVIELLGKCDNTQHPWRDRLRQLVEKNTAIRNRNKQEVLDKAHEIASDLWAMAAKHDEATIPRLIREMSEEHE